MKLDIVKLNASMPFRVGSTNPEFVHPTEKKLLGFLALTDGWHYGEGVAFERKRIDRAIQLVKTACQRGLYTSDAFPGIGGQVMVVIYHGNRDLEVTIEADDTVTIVHENDGQEESYKEAASFDEALEAVGALGKDERYYAKVASEPPIFYEIKDEDLPEKYEIDESPSGLSKLN